MGRVHELLIYLKNLVYSQGLKKMQREPNVHVFQ